MGSTAKRLYIALTTAALAFGVGCGIWIVEGSGHSETRSYPVQDFQVVENETLLDVQVTEGDDPSVEITCDDNLLDYFVVEERNGELRIRVENVEENREFVTLMPHSACSATVSAGSITRLSNTGSGDLTTEGRFADLRRISNTGSGDLDIEGELGALRSVSNTGSGAASARGIDVDEIEVNLTGSGDVKLAGDATELDLSATGSGSARAAQLIAHDATVQLTGSGSAEIHASGCLDVTIMGSGDVVVTGDPRVCHYSSTGSGDIVMR